MLLCRIRRPVEIKENPEKFSNFENWAHERLFSKKGFWRNETSKNKDFLVAIKTLEHLSLKMHEGDGVG